MGLLSDMNPHYLCDIDIHGMRDRGKDAADDRGYTLANIRTGTDAADAGL